MIQLQQNIIEKYSVTIDKVKINDNIYFRNPIWKPIDVSKFNSSHNYYPNWKFEEFRNKYPNHSDYHKKLMIEAQKYNPDEFVHVV